MPDTSHHNNFSDWETWAFTDPFEDMAGPFYFKRTPDGIVSGFEVTKKHLNGGGAIHGGMLMTFADFSLFSIAKDELGDEGAVTIALNGEFVSAGPPSGNVYATGEVVRATGSMVFVRGTVTANDATLLTFSGILKKLKKRN